MYEKSRTLMGEYISRGEDQQQRASVAVQTETMTQRVSKEDLFAIMALWMERCPLGVSNSQQTDSGATKAGAVFVGPNDRIVAMDCTRVRDGASKPVHAAARVLVKLPDKVRGCTVYMSRKPCSHCVKLLAQAEVLRIRFLPFRPEASPDQDCDELENARRVENLVRVCRIGLSVYVPNVDGGDNVNGESCVPITGEEYWSKQWQEELEGMEPRSANDTMRCSGLPDSDVTSAMGDSMKGVGRWIDSVTSQLNSETKFQAFVSNKKPKQVSVQNEVFLHMSRMSLIAAARTDDPYQGVGVVIMKKGEMVSMGMSGYPSKAMFGDFPRSNAKEMGSENKWPFLVHAEENALMIRNTRVIADKQTAAFVTKPPCNSCTVLLKEAGVRKIVLPKVTDLTKKVGYKLFYEVINNGEFEAFKAI